MKKPYFTRTDNGRLCFICKKPLNTKTRITVSAIVGKTRWVGHVCSEEHKKTFMIEAMLDIIRGQGNEETPDQ